MVRHLQHVRPHAPAARGDRAVPPAPRSRRRRAAAPSGHRPGPAAPASCCSDRSWCRAAARTARARVSRQPAHRVRPARPDRVQRHPRAGRLRGDDGAAARRVRPVRRDHRSRHVRPRNTPATPPMWSTWKWLTTNSTTCRTPSRRRQWSTAFGSGPASTTTARPGPAGSTIASPCPTAQATTSQPGGGHPEASNRTGSAPSTAAQRDHRDQPPHERSPRRDQQRDRDHREQQRPEHPAGPGHRPGRHPGARTWRPAPATGPASAPARPRTRRRAGQTGDSTAAATPSSVAGAIAGTTSRFAGTATRLTDAGQPGHHRPAGDLRGGRHGERLGRARRPPATAQRVPPLRREQQQPAPWPARTARNPASAGQLRVDEDQHGDPGGERGQRGAGPPGGQPEQPDRPHRRGPHDARRRPRQDHEADQRHRADQRDAPPARPGSSRTAKSTTPRMIATLAPLTAFR